MSWRLLVPIAVLAFVFGMAMGWFAGDTPAPGRSGAAEGDPRPGFEHRDLAGEPVSASDFDGGALLVNFWATWCAPCRREMPVLQATSERHAGRLAVVGIALDEAGPVRRFVDEVGVDYTILPAAHDGMATQRAWGNDAGVLPYTVLVDAEGIIRWQHYGEVESGELNRALGRVL